MKFRDSLREFFSVNYVLLYSLSYLNFLRKDSLSSNEILMMTNVENLFLNELVTFSNLFYKNKESVFVLDFNKNIEQSVLSNKIFSSNVVYSLICNFKFGNEYLKNYIKISPHLTNKLIFSTANSPYGINPHVSPWKVFYFLNGVELTVDKIPYYYKIVDNNFVECERQELLIFE